MSVMNEARGTHPVTELGMGVGRLTTWVAVGGTGVAVGKGVAVGTHDGIAVGTHVGIAVGAATGQSPNRSRTGTQADVASPAPRASAPTRRRGERIGTTSSSLPGGDSQPSSGLLARQSLQAIQRPAISQSGDDLYGRNVPG
jgi:hypothetical protein